MIWLTFSGGVLFVATKNLHRVPGVAGIIALSLLVALLSVYLPHLANLWFSRHVGIGEKAIVLMLPYGVRSWRYQQISEVRFVQDVVAGERLWLMMVSFADMPPVGLGVAKNIDVAMLAKRLRECGVSKVIVS